MFIADRNAYTVKVNAECEEEAHNLADLMKRKHETQKWYYNKTCSASKVARMSNILNKLTSEEPMNEEDKTVEKSSKYSIHYLITFNFSFFLRIFSSIILRRILKKLYSCVYKFTCWMPDYI